MNRKSTNTGRRNIVTTILPRLSIIPHCSNFFAPKLWLTNDSIVPLMPYENESASKLIVVQPSVKPARRVGISSVPTNSRLVKVTSDEQSAPIIIGTACFVITQRLPKKPMSSHRLNSSSLVRLDIIVDSCSYESFRVITPLPCYIQSHIGL